MKRFLWSFYEYESQKGKNSGMYQIEKNLRIRTNKGKRQFFVPWLGYNSDFDSWIAAEERFLDKTLPLPSNLREDMKLLLSIVYLKIHMISSERIAFMT